VRLAYGIPAYRQQVNVGHVGQALAMRTVADHFAAPLLLTWGDSCCLAWTRRHMMDWAIKQGCAWLLTADADTYHLRAGDIVAMLVEGVKRDAAIIASPVRMRNRNGFNLAKVNDQGEEFAYAEDDFRGKVIEVDQIGTGFMAINLDWIRACWPSESGGAFWFAMDQVESSVETNGRPGWNGEDYHFCRGVRARGGLILADGRFEPIHQGASNEMAALVDLGAVILQRAA
jgi:hypothetical protein